MCNFRSTYKRMKKNTIEERYVLNGLSRILCTIRSTRGMRKPFELKPAEIRGAFGPRSFPRPIYIYIYISMHRVPRAILNCTVAAYSINSFIHLCCIGNGSSRGTITFRFVSFRSEETQKLRGILLYFHIPITALRLATIFESITIVRVASRRDKSPLAAGEMKKFLSPKWRNARNDGRNSFSIDSVV